MNYSKAVKCFLYDPHEIINSAAETELGRKLTNNEFLSLTKKFSLKTVSESIDQVRY